MRPLDLAGYAAGGLRGHRLRTGLSLLGVAIGVASVILLTSIGEGARLFVTGEFASLGTNLLIVIPGKTETVGMAPFMSTAPHDLTVEDTAALDREVSQLRLVAPISLGSATASHGERSRDVTVIGTTHEMLEIRRLGMHVGRFLPPGVRDAPVCVIGAAVQRELFGNRNPLGEMLRVGESRFRIIGIVRAKGTSIGVNLDEVVQVPVENALRLFNRPGLFRIFAEVEGHRDIEKAKRAVTAVLSRRHDGEEDVTVLTQDAVLTTFERILAILTAALAGIAAISLSVAGIGIMNVMLVSVTERTREIGLLMAVGVDRRQVLVVFLLEAAAISSAGGVLGVLAGLGGNAVVRRIFPDFPVEPPVWSVGAALLVSTAIGLLFGALPARRASALDPVEALMRKRA
jgi:putative ABC transport system permease protein